MIKRKHNNQTNIVVVTATDENNKITTNLSIIVRNE